MRTYTRARVPGGTWFFTVNLAERHGTTLLVDRIDDLREAFRLTRRDHPFTIDAIVILPDHLHCLWQLPSDDDDFSTRWNLIKGRFSRLLPADERIATSRRRKRERGIWQRRYWEHLIRDERDLRNHMDYIHFNPVKHGHVQRVQDWPQSSFHRLVHRGIYSADWGVTAEIEGLDLE